MLQAVHSDPDSQLLQVLDGWVHLALAILPLMDAAAVKGKILLFAAARGVDREMGAQGAPAVRCSAGRGCPKVAQGGCGAGLPAQNHRAMPGWAC